MMAEDGLDGRAVVPGERIVANTADGVVVIAGPGTTPSGDDQAVIAVKAGIVIPTTTRSKGSKTITISVESDGRRYTPVANDQVIGVVSSKHGDHFRVDIGAPRDAYLPALAFQGATKRNRPNITVGTLIYGIVSVANIDMRPELTCISTHFKKEWMTGEALFGELQGGYMFTCSARLIRQLLRDDCIVLCALGDSLPFEITIGVNGRVWVRSDTLSNTILIANCILNSEHLNDAVTVRMVRDLLALRNQ